MCRFVPVVAAAVVSTLVVVTAGTKDISQATLIQAGDGCTGDRWFDSARMGNVDAIRSCISGAQAYGITNGLIQQRDNAGCSALAVAAAHGHVPLVDVLVLHGAKVHQSCRDGSTPLAMAACNGRVGMVRHFRDGLGANLYEPYGPNRSTTLTCASENGRFDVMLVIHGLDNESSSTQRAVQSSDDDAFETSTAFELVRQGDVDALHALVMREGADVLHSVSEGSLTLLMVAAFFGHANMCKALVGYGVPVDVQDDGGWSAMMFAALGGHVQAFSALDAAGGSLITEAKGGWTLLHVAASKGHKLMAEVFISRRFNPFKPLDDGRTARDVASMGGHLNIARALQSAEISYQQTTEMRIAQPQVRTSSEKAHENPIATPLDEGTRSGAAQLVEPSSRQGHAADAFASRRDDL